MSQQTVTYISPEITTDCQLVLQELTARTGINFVRFQTVGELFSSLSNPRFTTDLVMIDLDSLTKVNGANLFEIINTVSTLIKCTVVRVNPGKPVKRSIPIAVSAHTDTDPALFKQIVGTDVIGVYPMGDQFTIENKIAALTALINGESYMPAAIAEQIRPSKKKMLTKKNAITLTARQAQILQLICERGVSNKVIASTLKIAESTVKLHLTAVMKKYGVKTRTQLALFANKQKPESPV